MRVNLTIPEQMDALLERLAAVTGRTKASFILDAVTVQMDHWYRWVKRLETEGGSTVAPDADSEQKLTRQQRRALERERAKKREWRRVDND